MPGQISGKAVAVTTAGFVLAWSGIKGATIGDTLRDLLKGQPVPVSPMVAPTIGVDSAVLPAGTAAGGSVPASTSAIANDALKYQGHAYLYGGAPGPDGSRPWDCSSFSSWVLGHDSGLTLPGAGAAGYNGESHGPTTVAYLAWAHAQTVGHDGGHAQAGDLCVWQTHMGIALGGGQMISALNPHLGTQVTTITAGAPPGELLFVRRPVLGNPEA